MAVGSVRRSLGHSVVVVPLVVVGALAGLATILRLPSQGLDAEGRLVLAVAVLALGLAAALRTSSGQGLPVPPRVAAAVSKARAIARPPGLPGLSLPATLALVVVLGGAWLMTRPDTTFPGYRGGTLPFAGTRVLTGRAVAVSGDTLRIRGRLVRLAGIEAPARDQRCTAPGGRPWRCGAAAADALAHLLRGTRIRCELRATDEARRVLGHCVAGRRDIAAELVRGGHAFAEHGLNARYVALEARAKARKTGIWAGTAEPPSEWRTRVWEEARRQAPSGCPIKGRVTLAGKQYVLPWSPEYPRVRVRAARGERWFCSEREAQAAGWRPSRS